MKKHKRTSCVQGEDRAFSRYRPKGLIYNLIWTFHKYDVDFKPSVLHGHSGKYKLDALDGRVYEEQRCVGRTTKKELQRLHSDEEFQKFAWERIEWYRENYPQIPIVTPSWIHESFRSFRYEQKHSGWKNTAATDYTIEIKINSNQDLRQGKCLK